MRDVLLVGDCREVLKQFPDGRFDACITDPPYGIGAYKGDGKRVALIFPAVLPEIRRVLRRGGALAFFGRWPTYARWQVAAEEAGFEQRAEVIRDFQNGNGLAQKNGKLNTIHDTVYAGHLIGSNQVFAEGGLRMPYSGRNDRMGVARMNPEEDRPRLANQPFHPHPNGAWPKSILRTLRNLPGGRVHDGQKPLADCEWLVTLLTNEGDLVLDPFCGAGTIPLACANLGRSFVGVDIEQHWIDVSEKRLAEAARHRNLTLPMGGDD